MGYMWTLTEMELSLMYDILYTKAPVLHTLLCATRWTGLRHAALCLERWHKLRCMVLSLRRLAHSTRIAGFFRLSRRWSGTMGQYNMLEMCTARHGRLAGILGYSMPAVGVPDGLKDLVVVYIQHMIESGYVNTLGMVRDKWGTEALKRWRKHIAIDHNFLGAELQEGIIIWHIATDIFLANRHNTNPEDKQRVKEVLTLSNYQGCLS